MRTKNEIRDEINRELMVGGRPVLTQEQFEQQVDRRFHWERLVEEAQVYQAKQQPVRVEFVAAPGEEICDQCWAMNGMSFTLEEFSRMRNAFGCRCAVVLPDESL